MDTTGITVGLVAVLALVFANGFFVAAEFSLVTVRKTRIDQLIAEGHRGARTVRRALSDPDSYIAATQLGITMASLALGWIGEPALAKVFEPVFSLFGDYLAVGMAHTVSVVLSFAIITALHIVLGELAPKTVALQQSERVVAPGGQAHGALHAGLLDPILLLNGLGNIVVRSFGLKPPSGHSLVHSEEELKMLVTASQEAGVLEEEEEQMLHRVFAFSDLTAGQIMVPRTEMVALAVDTPAAEVAEIAARGGHARLPIYRKGIDDIIGILNITDLFHLVAKGQPPADLSGVVRDAFTVPETLTADDLLSEMHRRGSGIAIVIDEFGGTAGLVTFAGPDGAHRRRTRRRRAHHRARRRLGAHRRAGAGRRRQRAVRPARRRGVVQHAWRVRAGPAGTARARRRSIRCRRPHAPGRGAGWAAGRARLPVEGKTERRATSS